MFRPNGIPRPLALRLATIAAAATGFVAVALIAVAIVATAPASAADHGVPLPTENGSTWTIVAGYNTTSHFGDDPHALDIVRDDAPTAGSLVLSPVVGVLSWIGADCVVINDAAGMAHLLCHIFPNGGLVRGQDLFVGQLIGTVAAAGFAGNNGLSQIHYAVSATSGDGRLGNTVPFTGPYALEGRDLYDGGAFSEHGGESFTSTIGDAALLVVTPTVVTPTVVPPGAESDFLFPGWNLVGWTGDTAIEEATAQIAGDFASVLTFDAAAQQFRRYSPSLPPSLNEVDTLQFGDAVWIFVTQPDGAVWNRPQVVVDRDVPLLDGFNLVTWTAATRDVVGALAGLGDALISVAAYDPARALFTTYRPDAPAFLNDLDTLRSGQAVWVQLRADVVWSQR